MQAPVPWVDDCLISSNSQYLHVPYDWVPEGKIYRVRPNPSMEAGETYRGRLIIRQTAIQKGGGIWYWRLEFQPLRQEVDKGADAKPSSRH